jgi:predicted Zn-dependent peptidase
MEKMANGEIVIEPEHSKTDEIKEKFSSGIKSVGDKASGVFSKIGKKAEKEEKADPIEEIKKYKELLDLGIITQEEFDEKKKVLLNL